MIRKLTYCLVTILSMLVISCGEAPKPEKKEKAVAKQETAPPKVESVLSKCQLNMGWDPWEPYQYLSPDNKVRGLEIELVGAIAQEAGCELKFVQKSWMNLLNGIRNGSIDLLGGATKTVAREQFARFSDYYRHESFILYVRSGESEKYKNKSLKQLLEEGFRLGVTQDYIYGDQVTQLQDIPELASKFTSVPTTEVNYYNLIQNNIDGFLEDPFVAAYTIRRKGLQEQIIAHPLEIHSGDVSIMFSKNSVNEETVAAFNDALKRLKESGAYKKILDKYSHH
ncbi:ABC transporter substrate-binding protein [Aliikangiella sp. G2MR2-5]|uniref:substrate-binding periplasmic protein n=1 Tax=Aliikangiella sp. G2MR2-5 TaxID=2788943 RepID=UPI0018A89579|nr:transporter substrate-binding domain-containing protein [Aliikangiella sp. G2MR2-5]